MIRMNIDNKYVWYACYGSNILKERFMLYINGGFCRFNGRNYNGCSDTSSPVEDRPITLPYKLYFGNSSGSWDGGGVAFLEPEETQGVETLGRIYLITEDQFRSINKIEGPTWYDKILDLGTVDGVPVKTFTHSTTFPRRMPSQGYLEVVKEGIRETYPNITKTGIVDYINQV